MTITITEEEVKSLLDAAEHVEDRLGVPRHVELARALNARASDPASEVVERVRDAIINTMNKERDPTTFEALTRVAEAVLAATQSSPDASRMGASEVERVARAMYERVVRSSGKRQSWDEDSDEIERGIYLDDALAAIAALTPVSGHTDGTWEDAIEAAAKVAEDRHESWRMPHRDDAETGEVCCDVTACADIAAAIRNLSPRAASSEGGD